VIRAILLEKYYSHSNLFDGLVKSRIFSLTTISGMIPALGSKSKTRANALKQLDFFNANHRNHLFPEMLGCVRK
jgi:hypothetical protein